MTEEKSSQNQDHLKDKPKHKDIVGEIFQKDIKKEKPSSLFDVSKSPLAHEETAVANKSIVTSVPSANKAKPKSAIKWEMPRMFTAKSQKSFPFGIDIGDHSFKIVQLAKRESGVEVSKLILKEFPLEAIEKQQDSKTYLIKTLKETLKENELTHEAFCALPSNKIQIKSLVFPKMPYKEIEGAIEWEIRQMALGEAQGVSYDYVVLDEDKWGHQEKIEILLLVSSKKDVLDYLALFESAGIKILAVDTESLSHLASLNYNQLFQNQEVALVLDFGGSTSRLDIIKDRQLRFTRVLTTSGSTLTQAIKNYCHVSLEEAEKLKKSYGFANAQDASSEKWQLVKNAINLLLEKLVMDIDHTFKYYSYQMTKSTVTAFTKIVLSGGLAHLGILSSFLRDRLKVDIVVDDALKKISIPPATSHGPSAYANEGVRFGIAFGLALRGINEKS